MRLSEHQLTTTDHKIIQSRLWEPETTESPKAVVCLIHGFGEHLGRYQHVAQALTDANYVVWGLDSRGHGKSTGPRGFIPSYKQFLDDADVLMKAAKERFPDDQLFLYGHSTGGGLALRYVYENEPAIAGIVATSPWLRLARDPGFLGQIVMWIFSLFRPSFTIDTGFTPGMLSRDPAVDEAHIADPLTHGSMTAGLLTSGISNGQLLLKNAKDFPKIPLLLLHGTGDKIIAYAGSQAFASQISAETSTFISFDEGAHELHNDLCKTEVLETIVNWLDKQLL
ncbi:MAG: lysophospholipase [Anaerolineae bacterium]